MDGDLLLYLAGHDSRTHTVPTGWTELDTVQYQFRQYTIGYKIASSEGATATFTISSETNAGAICLRIVDHGADILAPEFSGPVTVQTSNPDPPNLAPAGGSDGYLWIALGGAPSLTSIVAPPTNYNLEVVVDPAGDETLWAASRALTASSENPGTFTISAKRHAAVWTIAISPFKVVVEVPAKSFSLSGQIPTTSAVEDTVVDAPAKSYALSGQVPSAQTGAKIVPPVGSYSLEGAVPAAGTSVLVECPTNEFVRSGFAPKVAAGGNVVTPTNLFSLAGQIPNVGTGVSIGMPSKAYAFSATAPIVGSGAAIQAGLKQFLLSGAAPVVLARSWTKVSPGVARWTEVTPDSAIWVKIS